jgi:hypothetical protein
MRRFWWDRIDRDKFMSYVAWDKIALPKELGGLGLRDMVCMNSALLMKHLFNLAANRDILWVQLVKAKYFPRGNIWQSKRMHNCTNFWRAIMSLREVLQQQVLWVVGNAQQCMAFG